uniref:Uncharacterized protein n=1 Tax=Cacopsylla melanoneura TaxID=428564 RepID=A0A8D8TM32_9HEMI
MFKRKSTQGLLFKTLLCVFILTINISTIKCDSTESVTNSSEDSTEISKETVRATENVIVKSEGKDIYIVFNDTESSTEILNEDLGSNAQDNLKTLVSTQETQLAAVPLGKHGDLGGIGHGGHGGGHKKKKIKIPKKSKKKHGKGGFGLMKMLKSKYMLIPQLIMLGFSPMILANLKMMVMHALMINNMALSTAVFMLIRNMVFGPSPDAPVKYHNLGYQKPSVYKHYIPPPEPHHPPVVHHAPPEHHHVYHPKPHTAPSQGPWPSHSHVKHIPPPPPPPPSAIPHSAESHSLEPQFNIHALTQETYNKPSSYSTGDINTFQPESGFSSSDSSFKGYEYKDNKYRSAEVEISPSVSSYFPSNEAADHHALVDGNYFKNDHERSSDNEKEADSSDFQSSKSHPTTTVDSFKQYSSMKAHASYRLSAR